MTGWVSQVLIDLSAFLRLIRVQNSIMASVAVVIGALVVRADIPFAKLSYAAFSAFLISASSFAINDLCDRDLDKSIGRPNPITNKRVTIDEAAFTAIVCSFFGIYVSTLAGSLITTFLALVSALLGYLYSIYLKPKRATIGHLATSYSTGITYVYGWSVFGFWSIVSFTTVFFMFALSMIANFSREIVKVMADCEGDAEWGIKTLAVTRGRKAAGLVALEVMVFGALFSYIPLILGIFHSSYYLVVTFVDILLILLVLVAYLEPTAEMAVRVKNDLLKVMALGLIAFLSGAYFEYYSMYALLLEAITIGVFVALFKSTALRYLLPLLIRGNLSSAGTAD